MCIVYNRLRLSSELQPVLSSREILSSSMFSYCEEEDGVKTVEDEPTAAKEMDSCPKDAAVVKGSTSTGSTKPVLSPEKMSAFQKRAVQFDYIAKFMSQYGKSASFACNLDVMCFCRASNSIQYKWIYISSVSVRLSLGAL